MTSRNVETVNPDDPALYLCSRSPRRRELLEQIGLTYALVDAPIDETPLADESALAYVERLAIEKAAAGADELCRTLAVESLGVPVLGADTSVIISGEILGKPADYDEAKRMLKALSGTQHDVCTGIALHDGKRCESTVSRSAVWFRTLTDDEIREYWESGEPRDKAGAYAIQGAGGRFVERIEGSYSGIVGLPLYELDEMLRHWV